ncbi:Ger(x)C family spore germination protein [Metabacillus idriensis]|uniref:Ger(x)C family spore germination protein n=1 Tax=Metabacillus idriensis TaxID=324768 RepID=UPI002813B413|nr:Ger(x)C family spore germination protein [Metabacillus idriensis]MDR0139530.1 Ger(x)C family spore germination protein [Metabacillus idriensis]
MITKQVKLFMLLSSICLVLSGCWGSRGISDQLYIEALGVDYKDGKYIVYTESAIFSSIAKQEGGGSQPSESPVLVGKEEAESLTMAFRKLEKASQFPLYYGHIQVILLSERVINQKLEEVISHIGHDPLIRFTSWVFGTSEELSEVLKTKSLFNQAPTYKVLFHPDIMLSRNHAVNPLNMQMLLRGGNEPYGSILIPNVSITEGQWHEDEKKPPTPHVNGGFIVSKMKSKGFMPYEDLHGLQWLTEQQKENKLEITHEETVVELLVKGYKITLHEPVKDGLHYTVQLKTKAFIDESADEPSLASLKKKIQQEIKNDVQRTFENGLKLDADLYNLTESTYRKSPSLVKKYKLQEDSLSDIQVEVVIVNAGSQKYK